MLQVQKSGKAGGAGGVETDVTVEIVKVENIAEIVKRGVLSTPMLVIDGEVKLVGRTASTDEMKKWIGKG